MADFPDGGGTFAPGPGKGQKHGRGFPRGGSRGGPRKRPNRGRGRRGGDGHGASKGESDDREEDGSTTTPAGEDELSLSSTAPTPAPSHPASGTVTPSGAGGTGHLTNVRFDSLKGKVDERTLRGVPFEYMTEVQAATVDAALAGEDILAQAKTGTGKTVAFLIPAIQGLVNSTPQPTKGNVSVLVLSPTRELAMQIDKEAKMLLQHHHYGTQFVVGGTNMSSEQRRLQNDACDILVATPGRLLDHLDNSGLAQKVRTLKVLVLDEADRLLDMGFRHDLEKILARLPDKVASPRQTLLFSATIPDQVHGIANLALSSGHRFISTLKEDDVNTHEHVSQHLLTMPLNDQLAATLYLLDEERKADPQNFKIIAFAPTARMAGLMAAVFRELGNGLNVWELHSRKTQAQRTNAMEAFRKATTGVMFASDALARGVDVPNVTCVMQIGLPANAEQYTHRLGRTARAGAQGKGVLVLSEAEAFFVRKKDMASLPLQPHPPVPEDRFQESKRKMQDALTRLDDQTKAQGYQAQLGFFKSSLRDLRWSPAQLVENLNDWATNGLLYTAGTPPLLAKTVGMMGLRGTPGLNVVSALPGRDGNQRSSSRGGGRGGRGGRRNGSNH